jgi:hypothetical protein
MSILQNAKEIADLVKKYNDQELYNKLVSLREEILELRESNILLKEKIQSLDKAKDISELLVREGNVYINSNDPIDEGRMYCLTCWDYDSKLVNVSLSHVGKVICQICSARKM